MSLFSAAERFAALDHSDVTLNSERCLYSQDRFSGCEACYSICPASAIMPGKPPSLDSKKCQSCLACLTVCPVGAFTADDAVASLLNAVTHLEGSELELVCERNPHAAQGCSAEATGMRVKGCLAGLGSGTYLSLAAFGLERILVRTDACSTCEWGSLTVQIKAQVGQAKQLLEAWGKADSLNSLSELESPVERELWEAKNPPLSRRDMFRMVTQQGKVALARAMEEGQVSKRGLGRNHLRILGAVTHLPAPHPGYLRSIPDMDFASVSVSEACTACGVCARACPTQALHFESNKNDTEYSLKFSARQCIGCEMCMHVCAPSAVSVDHAPTFAQIFGEESISLREGNLVKCEHCGIPMAAKPNLHLCQLCEYRQTHPFGSMSMPGIKGILPGTREKHG